MSTSEAESQRTEQIRANAYHPHEQRLSPDHPLFGEIMAAHDAAVAAGPPGYLDPGTGLFVMTADHHVRRGKCCHNGCRHCPYVGAQE